MQGSNTYSSIILTRIEGFAPLLKQKSARVRLRKQPRYHSGTLVSFNSYSNEWRHGVTCLPKKSRHSSVATEKNPRSFKLDTEALKVQLGRLIDADLVKLQLERFIVPASEIWSNTEPWIKWPFAIFAPWYLLVSLFYGIQVSRELTPFWVLGPVLSGMLIKALLYSVHVCNEVLAKTPLPRIGSTVMQVYGDITSGHQSQYGDGISHFLAQKKEELDSYIQSGKAAEDTKHFVILKLSEIWDFIVEKYEDWRDWYKLFYFKLARKLGSLF